MEQIGFIGIGLMGHGMAKNLLEKGYKVVVTAHKNRKPIESLLAKGATEAKTAKEVAAASSVIILCVTGAPHVASVVYGDDGVLAGIKEGAVLLDCSTNEPSMVDKVAADLKTKKAYLVDAPLARTPVEAEAGRLNTMVGGDEAIFARVKPVLETFCENIFYMGDVGAGARTKLIYNLLTMGYAALISEAVAACGATGVDLSRFAKVVGAGGANSGIFQLLVPKIIESGDYSGLKFSLANAAKDLRYYNRMVFDLPLSGEMAPAVHNALVTAMKNGKADGLVGDMIDAHCKTNGVKLKVG